MTSDAQAETLSEDERARLLARPELILSDRDLMRALIGARETEIGENVIDIRGRAMQALDTRLDRLESTHESVISTAYENQTGMHTVHRAVLSLLEPMDVEGFLENLETTVAPILHVETLRLVMETGGTLPEPESSGPLVIVPEGTIAGLISGGRRMPSRRWAMRSPAPVPAQARPSTRSAATSTASRRRPCPSWNACSVSSAC